ncbi:MAG: hypothetical protein DI598_05660 [Pseudopedobacter saltans]|uniref:TonB-dependent receptor plug n=1 Tax=Pseudopedobacter saltans TaxID=151895 RepID=A0A2W5F9K8_9SPHI|nr:MAG: hypothetical protein DI598_05660 [Pseudopedobacter saltans]
MKKENYFDFFRTKRSNKKWFRKTFSVLSIFIFVLLSNVEKLQAQDINNKIRLEVSNKKLSDVLHLLEGKSGFRISYNPEEVEDYDSISLNGDKRSIQTILNLILAKTELSYIVTGQNIILYTGKNPEGTSTFISDGKGDMISGIVTDSMGNALSDVSVIVKGTNKGVMSNRNGEYSIHVPPHAILSYSYLGYHDIEINPGNKTVVNVTMMENVQHLESLVVTGYMNKKPSEVTGSIVQLNANQLTGGVTSTLDIYELLKGKVPGLQNMTIRGMTNMTAGQIGPTTPLIILDGNIMGNVDLNTLINPADIQTISVLKDAASTAIYGSRAALGVIVVTTKKGKKGLTVNVTDRIGALTLPRRMKYMNTNQWITHVSKYLTNYYDANKADYEEDYPTVKDFLDASKMYSDEEAATDFNWDKALHKTGFFNETTLSFSTGSQNASLYGSVGWYREKGNDLGSKNDRKTAKINADFNISPRLTVSLQTSALIARNISQNGDLTSADYLPFINPKDDKGNWRTTLPYRAGSFGYVYGSDVPNVLYENKSFDNTYKYTTENYVGTAVIRYTPTKYLTLQSSNTVNHTLTRENSYYDPRSQSGKLGSTSTIFQLASWYPDVDAGGTLDLSFQDRTMWITSNTVNYHQTFGDHIVHFLAGQEYSRVNSEATNISYYTLLPDERNAGAATNIGNSGVYLDGLPYSPSGSQSESAMFSAFGEGSYQYKQIYVFTANIRTDASPSFGKNNRYGTFYSLSGGWLMHKEAFMQSLSKTVTFLKLRYAYGTSGRDLGGSYLNKTYYNNNRSYNNVPRSGSIISQLANNNIKWETTYNNSVGVDFTLWNRLNGTIDLYRRKSKDLVQTVTLPATQGGYTQNMNIGEVINKGIEVSLNGDIIQQKDFQWNLSANISSNSNKITKVSPDVRTFYLKPGQSIGDEFGIPYVGVNPDNGAPLFRLGDGSITDGLTTVSYTDTLNMVKVGNKTPKYYGGIQSAWTYKNLTLSMEWYFEVGQIVSNYDMYTSIDPSQAFSSGTNSYRIPSSWYVWSGPGDTKANMPNIYDGNMGNWLFNSPSNSLFDQKGSYLRWRNARLSYNIPALFLSKYGLKSLSVFGNIDNVLVIKKKSNWRDYESVNSPMRMVFGLNLGF